MLIMTHSSRPSFAVYCGTRYFGCLNGLRFLCITAVLWHHAPIWNAMENPARILTRGFTGVDFFFVLSGYLITTLLVREAATNGSFSLRAFYWRRLLRIVPVYFFVVTSVAVYFIGIKGEVGYLAQLPYYYLFLSNFLTSHVSLLAPTWSLSVEEQYYLIWPLLLMVLPQRALLPAIAGLILVNVAAVIGWLSPLGITAFEAGPLRFAMFNATYAPILIGSAAAILLQNARSFGVFALVLGSRVACLGTFSVVILLLASLPEDLRGWPNLALHLAMTAALISIVIREDNFLRPVLSWRPIARIGAISYGIYLYHLIALHIAGIGLGMFGVVESNWPMLFLYSLISIVMAEASFRTLESWFLSYKMAGWGKLTRT